jgi:hypothetical protein
MLRLRVSDEHVLEVVSDIEKVKSALSSLLGITFDPPDIWAHGYATQRARLGTKESPQWVWISPNTVPRGFVRKDDRRYCELKDLLPGNAERFPELPPSSYILKATGGVRAKVIGAFTQCGLTVRPLRECVKG